MHSFEIRKQIKEIRKQKAKTYTETIEIVTIVKLISNKEVKRTEIKKRRQVEK